MTSVIRVYPPERSFLPDDKLREIVDHLLKLASRVFSETVVLKEDVGIIPISLTSLKSSIVYFNCKASKEYLESLELLKGKPTGVAMNPRHHLVLLSLGIKVNGLGAAPVPMASSAESRNFFFKYVLEMHNNIEAPCQEANEADLHRTWIQLETTLLMSPGYKETAYYYYQWFSENPWPEVINDHHMDELASIAGIDKKWPLLKEMESYKEEGGEAAKWKAKAEQAETERVKLVGQVNMLASKVKTVEKAVKAQTEEIAKTTPVVTTKAQEAAGKINLALAKYVNFLSEDVKKDAIEVNKIKEETEGLKKIADAKGDKLTSAQLKKVIDKLETKVDKIEQVGENLKTVGDIVDIAQVDEENMTDPARLSIGKPPSVVSVYAGKMGPLWSSVGAEKKPAPPSGAVKLPPAPPSGAVFVTKEVADIVAQSLPDLPMANRSLATLLKSGAGKLRPVSFTGKPRREKKDDLADQLAKVISEKKGLTKSGEADILARRALKEEEKAAIKALRPVHTTSESEESFGSEDGHKFNGSFGSLAKIMAFDDGEEEDEIVHPGATKWPDIVSSFDKESGEARKRSFENIIHNYG